MEYEKDYFTHTAYSPYMDFGLNADRVRKIIELTNPKSVLEAGCAYGYMVRRFIDAGIPAMGIDISGWAEEQAKTIIPGCFIKHDIRKPLPFKDKEFDLLYCDGVLEHIEEEFIPSIMMEFERVADRRLFGITFLDGAPGHLCRKGKDWWLEKLPPNSWLYVGKHSMDVEDKWGFKGLT